jgi:hypothetical protein
MPPVRTAWSGIRNLVRRTAGTTRTKGGTFGLSALVLLGAMIFLTPQKASSIGTLTGTWSCGAYAGCVFNITSNNHPAYQLNYGDGVFSGVQTTHAYWHTYSIPTGPTPRHFTAYILAYATTGGGSPDNIIGCTVTTYNAGVGGDPTNFSGSCTD